MGAGEREERVQAREEGNARRTCEVTRSMIGEMAEERVAPRAVGGLPHTRTLAAAARLHIPSRAGKERAGKGFAARATLLNHWTLTFVPEDHNLELRALRERAVVHQPLRVSQAPGSVALELKQKLS